MYRTLFGFSGKKVKEDKQENPENSPQDFVNDYVFIDKNSGPALYPPLDDAHLPYGLAPSSPKTNENTNSSLKKDNFLDNIPFQLSPHLHDEHQEDLEILLRQSKSILESKQHCMYDYSFALEKSVLNN